MLNKKFKVDMSNPRSRHAVGADTVDLIHGRSRLWQDCGHVTLFGRGTHRMLKLNEQVDVVVIAPSGKRRLVASGFVQRVKRPTKMAPELSTTIKLDGRVVTEYVKRRGKWVEKVTK